MDPLDRFELQMFEITGCMTFAQEARRAVMRAYGEGRQETDDDD